MVFNRFATLLFFRVILLTVTLAGLSVALTSSGYYGITLLLTIVATALFYELYRYVTKTNVELSRFLDAARYEDFGQRFKATESQGLKAGAGFERLSDVFDEIMHGLKQTHQRQEEKLRHLQSLTEHVPVPLLSLYPDGRVELHNNAARRLFSGIVVNRIENLSIFGEEVVAAIESLEPGSRRLINFSFDEVERQLSVLATQVVTATGNEKLISLQDIQSELDDVELRTWQGLVRVLTHEIMNSITPVASLAKTATDLVDDATGKLDGSTSTTRIQEELKVELQQELGDVRRAVDTVARRSDGLMQFVKSYRSLTQMSTPRKQTLPVVSLLQRIKALFVNQWAEKGITLKIEVEPEDLQLSADPDLLEQLLINLLQNAEQSLMDSQSTAIESQSEPMVMVRGRLNRRGYVLLEVIDNGPGVPAEIAEEIFVPFFTTKRQGAGIGLALTRQIMIAHGGAVTLSQSEIGGAKFTLIF
ncbi:sensor histidine kinase [Aliikangiella coralliicola]|uniref:histidine kinase n=1 Tax=Aliikangiella coralliicola TaxID=2592383 RepID=A0A545U4F8_9GAMM|nr:ATP-binding protein [Aliikangiella coralliicola]TQV84336.1 histidine kinase [Aliikangiella coralliicola]